MPNYRVLALSEEIARFVRVNGRDPHYRHPSHTDIATGYGPCRQCLQFFKVGEDRRILFTHDGFRGLGEFPLPGPIFIHETECVRYPELNGFPIHLSTHRLTLESYSKKSQLLDSHYLVDGAPSAIIEQRFDRIDTDFIIVRDTRAGCFDCVIVGG